VIVVVEERERVARSYVNSFRREGIASDVFDPADFGDWVGAAPATDVSAIEAFLLGDGGARRVSARLIRGRSRAPIIALNERGDLEAVLALFEAGVDDVVRPPVDVREILARVSAIRRRQAAAADGVGDILVPGDGGDPVVGGRELKLPRRERRILEYLLACGGRRVSKTQLFNAVYGLFEEEAHEQLVESHVCKLRKKLRARLGYDPIECQRYLGYRLTMR
jgi:DNA-binding response OmpR family regulator